MKGVRVLLNFYFFFLIQTVFLWALQQICVLHSGIHPLAINTSLPWVFAKFHQEKQGYQRAYSWRGGGRDASSASSSSLFFPVSSLFFSLAHFSPVSSPFLSLLMRKWKGLEPSSTYIFFSWSRQSFYGPLSKFVCSTVGFARSQLMLLFHGPLPNFTKKRDGPTIRLIIYIPDQSKNGPISY